jgi:hypothetical protein
VVYFGLSIIKHVTLQKIVAYDFRYDPRIQAIKSRRMRYVGHVACVERREGEVCIQGFGRVT